MDAALRPPHHLAILGYMLSPVSPRHAWHRVLLFLLLPLFIAFELYGPTLHAPFLFDDKVLPFAIPRFEHLPLSTWVSGTRPVLMFFYWLNYGLAGSNTGPYHAINILLHFFNSILAYAILRCFVPSRWPAVFLAAIFLLHPLQTESVSYIAGRSESLCAFFFLAAYALYLRRPPGPITWRRSGTILMLYGAAILTKEHAVVLPALFLLTDAFESAATIRRNWRIHAPIAVLALAGLAMVAKVLSSAVSAGFNIRNVTWNQYALTQTRAILQYLRLAILPFGQSVDHDFPISHSLTEHYTWLFLSALVLFTAAAFYFRRSYPIAAFGFLAFLLLLAPTSSVVPIADPFAERRMYMPLLALLIISAEALRRVRLSIPVAIAVLAFFSFLTYQRNMLWSDPLALWLDTVSKGPQKGRPYSHLAQAAVSANRCPAFVPFFEEASQRLSNDYYVLTGHAKILECAGQPAQAIPLLQRAARLRPSAEVYELIGLLYGELENAEASRKALESAIRLDPQSASAHLAMGLWYQSAKDLANAATSYKRVLEIEPNNRAAVAALRAIDSARTASP
jgi:protein O-mannosyl-transferase